jgi:hypothetical protein
MGIGFAINDEAKNMLALSGFNPNMVQGSYRGYP